MSDAKPVKNARFAALLGKHKPATLAVALLITSLIALGFVWAHKTVAIYADGIRISVGTLHNDPATVLVEAGITLGAQDEYRLSTEKLVSGTVIRVYRARPVTVTYQGKTERILTAKPTVGEVAQALNIPSANTQLLPAAATKVTSDMEITVLTLSERQVAQQAPVPFPVIREPDQQMESGTEETIQQGEDGLKSVKLRLLFADNRQTATETIAEDVIVAPKPQIVRVGTRDTVSTSRGDIRFKRIERMEATAYTPFDGSWQGITKSGIPARNGIVAVDPEVIPLGTRVYIPGYGLALAADTGSDIVGDRIDLCMEGHADAWNFGRRMVKVYILAD
jgi:3D (Asp-Asp-Asp) domain-containing protein